MICGVNLYKETQRMSQAPWEELGSEIHRLLDVSTPRTRERVAALYAACRSNPVVNSIHSVGSTATLLSSTTSASSTSLQQNNNTTAGMKGKNFSHHHRDPLSTTPPRSTTPAPCLTTSSGAAPFQGGPICVLPGTPTCLASFATSSSSRGGGGSDFLRSKWLIAATLNGRLHAYHSSWHSDGGGSGRFDHPWQLTGGSVSTAPHGVALCMDVMSPPKNLLHSQEGDHSGAAVATTRWVAVGTSTGAVMLHRFEPHRLLPPGPSHFDGSVRSEGGSATMFDDALWNVTSPPATPFGLGLTSEFNPGGHGEDTGDSGDRFGSPASSSQAPSKELVLIPWAASSRRRSSGGGEEGYRHGKRSGNDDDDDDIDSMDPPSDSHLARRRQQHVDDDFDVAEVGSPCGGAGGGVGSMILSGSESRSSLGSSTPSSDDGLGRSPPCAASGAARRLQLSSPPAKHRQNIPEQNQYSSGYFGTSFMATVGHILPSPRHPGLTGSATALTTVGGEQPSVFWGTRCGEVHMAHVEQFSSTSTAAAHAHRASPMFSGSIGTNSSSPITKLSVLSAASGIVAASTWDGLVWVFDTRSGPRPVSVAPPCRRSSTSATERAFHTIAAGFSSHHHSGSSSATGGQGGAGGGGAMGGNNLMSGAPIRSLFRWDDDLDEDDNNNYHSTTPSSSFRAESTLLAAADDDGIIRLLDTRRFHSASSSLLSGTTSSMMFTKAQSAASEVWALRAGHKPIVYASRQRRGGIGAAGGTPLTVCFKDNSIKRLTVHESTPKSNVSSTTGKRSGGDRGDSSGEKVTPTTSPTSTTHSLSHPHKSKTDVIRAKRGAAGVFAYVEQNVELDTSTTRSLGSTVACTEVPDETTLSSSSLIQGLSGGVVSCLPLGAM
ncbi:Hypothetical protein, putative [Bodo saltans]|uniref:Uncharacterized protein n=1 Tax=Bodo saltans TaxID=75058 RepID=A0A0S4KGH3_BODSA|nr:Hypothetical protein, putative [Bodo saltans]|eukprot:CUI14769.1 Hypothetical protein, putative [Bodo saltans]